MGLCPTIYTTIRTFLLGQLPDSGSYSIAGQLSWVNLFYEVVDEAIILPLFYFMGKSRDDKKDFTNRLKTGLLVSLGVYLVFSAIMIGCARPLLKMMAANPEILEQSVIYIRIESVANIFNLTFTFASVALVTLGKDKYVYILTGAKLILCIIFDIFLVSKLPCSANLGVNGIGISNIIVNLLLTITTLIILARAGYNIINKDKLEFNWMKGFLRKGSISGLESFVRNFFYLFMVMRMLNVVSEQGTYWVANNFIWQWLLLPINQLGELIKQEISTDKNAIKEKTISYFFITGCIIFLWMILIPSYRPFITAITINKDVDKVVNIVMILLGFYVCYAIQNVFDMTFYATGKIQYMLAETVITNVIYYAIFFILFKTNVWIPSLIGIALMFGGGCAFDALISFIAYIILIKKLKLQDKI